MSQKTRPVYIVPPQRTVHLAPTGDLAVCIVETLPNGDEAMVEVRTTKEAQALVDALTERFNLKAR